MVDAKAAAGAEAGGGNMTLTLYIARRFLKMFGLVFGVFAAILLLIDVIDQLR